MRPNTGKEGGGAVRDGLAGLGVAALAVACCGALPLLAGVVGGLALGAWLGLAAAVAALACAALAFAASRRRSRAACSAEEGSMHPHD